MTTDGVPWYHTIDLPAGPTDGEYDLRRLVDKALLPASLAGKRCLDVGTHDGFWAFEMERRGAGEVVAIDIELLEDIDWPEPRPAFTDDDRSYLAQRKHNFEIAHAAIGSAVQHRYLSVYDLDPALVGEFDFVHIGSLLQHLRDPVGALMRIRSVGSQLLVTGTFSLWSSVLLPRDRIRVMSKNPSEPFWHTPNLAALRGFVERAGFEIERQGRVHLQPRKHRPARPRIGTTGVRAYPGALIHWYGVPHVGILATARPASQ